MPPPLRREDSALRLAALPFCNARFAERGNVELGGAANQTTSRTTAKSLQRVVQPGFTVGPRSLLGRGSQDPVYFLCGGLPGNQACSIGACATRQQGRERESRSHGAEAYADP